MKAFPILDYKSGTNSFEYKDTGMDLRDYFAAKAMQAKLSNPNYQQEILSKGQEWILKDIFAWADAMMEERK